MSAIDGKVCVNCRFWENGLCRHSPPHPTGDWPRTKENDWCGRWEPEAPNRRRERETADTMDDLA